MAGFYDRVKLKIGGYIEVYQGYDIPASSVLLNPGDSNKEIVNTLVPSGGIQALLLTHYANAVSDIAAWTYVTWYMTVNGRQIAEYSNITNQIGEVNRLRPIGIDIIIRSGERLIITASASALMPAPYSAVNSLLGVYGNEIKS